MNITMKTIKIEPLLLLHVMYKDKQIEEPHSRKLYKSMPNIPIQHKSQQQIVLKILRTENIIKVNIVLPPYIQQSSEREL